jgi:hypothetical protein
VGSIYETVIEFLNITDAGRRIRILPIESKVLSIRSLEYENAYGL